MSNVFYTSDTHFQHQMVAGLRGYDTVEEHDEDIIDTWNRHITKRDIVWHLGDVTLSGLTRVAPILSRLNGTIHLVAGNHDLVHPMHRRNGEQRRWMEHFASIHTQALHKIGGNDVMLSHFPMVGEGGRPIEERYSEWRLRPTETPVLHGHTHAETIVTNPICLPTEEGMMSVRHVHVGWDTFSRPFSRDEVEQFLFGSYPAVWPEVAA